MFTRTPRHTLAVMMLILCFTACTPSADEAATSPGDTAGGGLGEVGGGLVCDTGSLPGAKLDGAVGPQQNFDRFSWQTFAYLNDAASGGAPLWTDWSSSVDLLAPVEAGEDPLPFGQHYYPAECQSIDGYENKRVLDQVNKVNDSLFEATTRGLSGKPVVDSNGNFLRYEILLSEATYNDIVSKKYYEAAGQADGVNLICAAETNTGPADPASGAMNLKLAWMEEPAGGATTSSYSEQFLVYTPAALTSDNTAICTLANHQLVGMHIARKTINQQAWLWATFEQASNAPDCTEAPPAGGDQQGNLNTSCPALSDTAFNFMPTAATCADGACASCNAAPSQNCPTDIGYCVDQGPAATAGYSSLCRQVSTYDTETNTQCQEQVAGSVWANYDLISTQWFASTFESTCENSSSKVYADGSVQKASINPQVAMQSGSTEPYLANTSMESYERSNCMGCHSKAVQAGTGTDNVPAGPSTDFVYYLMLEVEPSE